MHLRGEVVAIESLESVDRRAMLALMRDHFDNVQPDRFAADLAEKDWAIVVRDAGGLLRGFSTQRLIVGQVDGRAFRVLFSGDTIVDRACWGEQALIGTWGRLALTLIDQEDPRPLFWYLLSKGFRTYRFLPVFFREFYPRHDAPSPADMQAILHRLGHSRYGSRYDPDAGLVLAGAVGDRLRPELAETPVERLLNPHVRFFHARNPNYQRGDELCCLAPLSRGNFRSAAYRDMGLPDADPARHSPHAETIGAARRIALPVGMAVSRPPLSPPAI